MSYQKGMLMKRIPSVIKCENCGFAMTTDGLPMIWPDEDTPSVVSHN